jgi:hypothetical protein
MKKIIRNKNFINKKKQKTHKKVNKKKRFTKKYHGGDVFNHLFCKKGSPNNPRPSLHPEDYLYENESSVAMEYFMSFNTPFEVCKENIEKLLEFKKSEWKWFKFLIFIISSNTYIYAIDGFPKVNKHPLCYLFGIIEKTNADEYIELKKAFEIVKLMKENNIQGVNEHSPEIIELNSQIFANLSCMKVKSAGSGTILENNTICINNKSGHFKAKFEDIEPYAKDMFIEKTGLDASAVKAATQSQIIMFLNNNGQDIKLVNRYSGLCI